jgi:hypothetical protein
MLICDYLRQHIADDGLTFLVMAIETGLLSMLLKCYPWLDAATLKSWTQLLCDELPKYMIYISVLRLTHKSLASIRSLGLNKRLRGAAADSWAAFQAHVDKCSEFCTAEDLAKTRPCSRANVYLNSHVNEN